MTVMMVHTGIKLASAMPMIKRTAARLAKLPVAAVQHIKTPHVKTVDAKNLATGRRWISNEVGYSNSRYPKEKMLY